MGCHNCNREKTENNFNLPSIEEEKETNKIEEQCLSPYKVNSPTNSKDFMKDFQKNPPNLMFSNTKTSTNQTDCKKNNALNQLSFSHNKTYSENNLANQLLEEINQIRTNPQSYKSKIKKYMLNIIYQNGKFLLKTENEIYLSLMKGESAFEDALKYLSHSQQMLPLQMIDELKIDLEYFNEGNASFKMENFSSSEFIDKSINKIKKKIKNKYEILGFHYDMSTNNPELSTVMQIVDDTNSFMVRRNIIMNPKVRYIGISILKLKPNVFCYYLVFAKKTNDKG
ncbi:MAG: hypothetical protein MJ252_21860 [archaeon]|nr:hypothetical protein [archaeon]